MPKMIGYQKQVNGLVLIAEDTDCTACSSVTFDIPAGYASIEFHFVNVHPEDSAKFQFQVNAVGGSGFDEPITSTFFRAYHVEADNDQGFAYENHDQANADAVFQTLNYDIDQDQGNESVCGVLTLYDPSSPTYLKHFMSRTQANHSSAEVSLECFASGYINTITPIDEIKFKFHLGEIDNGLIRMYGVT